MDEHLAGRTVFVGGRLSLADIALYAYTHVAGGRRLRPRALPRTVRLAGAGSRRSRGYVPMDA